MFKRMALVLSLAVALWPAGKAHAEDSGDWIVLLSLGAGLYPAYTLWSEQEDRWVFLPVLQPNYRAGFTMAMMGGDMHSGYGGGRERATGFELGFNSMLLQPLRNSRIRQQISHVSYNRNGARISTLEANAHYLIGVSPGLELGFGPGIGVVEVGEGNTKRVGAFQLGVSAHYRTEDFYLGAELRHQFTQVAKLDEGRVDADNTRLMLKLGFWL